MKPQIALKQLVTSERKTTQSVRMIKVFSGENSILTSKMQELKVKSAGN